MNPSDSHPNKETLRKFALGLLESNTVEEISAHLDSCATCNQFLDQDFEDTLADRLSDLSSSSSDQEFVVNLPEQEDVSFEKLKSVLEAKTKYQLLQQLGSGGMGTVYLAHHSVMGRKVAIKVVKDRIFSDPRAIKRFEIETKSAAQLSHPNIVAAYDADQIDGIHFLVMEYVDGESLAEVLKRKGPLSIKRACNYVYQVAVGLRHAHSQSMIHRDIKPQNLMKTKEGRIKILDFGLARIQASEMPDQHLTQSGVMMGTANYVAPEQARDGRNADIRSDLYSLGCTLYTLLTAKVPFPKGTYMDKVLAHCTKPFPSISLVRNDIPESLQEVIKKLTAKKPEDRFQNPKELVEALEPFVKSDPAATADDQDAGSPKLSEDDANIEEPVAGDLDNGLNFPSPANSSFDQPDTAKRRTFLLFGFSLLLLIAAGVWGIPRQLGTGNGMRIGSNIGSSETGGNGGATKPGNKKILVFVSQDKFWYGDYGPLVSEMKKNGIEVDTISLVPGTARYDQSDSTPGARDIEVDFGMDYLDDLSNLDKYQGIVFIGNSVQEFVSGEEIEELFPTVFKAVKGKRWIFGIGRGMSIPLYYQAFNQVKISRCRYINSRFYRDRSPILEDQNVVIDSKNKVITCSDWNSSREAAETFAGLLLGRNQQ